MANVICPRCGAELPFGRLSCEVCGASLAEEYDICPDCGAQVRKGALFCMDCGAVVNEESTPVGDFSFIEKARQEVAEPLTPAAPTESVPEVPVPEDVPEEPKFAEAPPAFDEKLPPSQPEARPYSPQPAYSAPAAEPPYTAYPSAPAEPPVPPVSRPMAYTPPHRTPPPPQPEISAASTGFVRSTQPPKGSRFAPVSTWGFVGIILLFSVPVIGWIFCLVWACGGCTKVNKRNLARAYILIFVLLLLVSILTGVLLYFFANSWFQSLLDGLRI